MRHRGKLYFTGADCDESYSTGIFWTPGRVVRLSLLGVAFVLLIAVYTRYNSTSHILKQMNYSDQVDYMKRQGATGVQEIVDFLLNPTDEETVFMYLKLVDGELCSESMENALCLAQPNETGDGCLVSLSLCMLRNPAGLPRFIDLIRNGKPGEARVCSINYFRPPDEKCNPLQKHYGRPDDLQWAFAVIEDSLRHTFEGETIEEKRNTVLQWWEINKAGNVIDWQINFLKSPTPYNRTDAFDFILRRVWKNPEYIPTLVDAMTTEEIAPIKHRMACHLFRLGVSESLPIFDEFVRTAKKDEDISAILAAITHVVDLPIEYFSIDSWADGRDDAKSFTWFHDWWIRNYDLLVFDNDKWRCIGVAADNPENDLFD